ncbi:MAG: hypothetical protein JWO38_1333 [Gemmataceae bacterium]|nr:hypothetical protein [Gemmataceae bacterium]
MTEQEITDLGPAFAAYLRRFHRPGLLVGFAGQPVMSAPAPTAGQ